MRRGARCGAAERARARSVWQRFRSSGLVRERFGASWEPSGAPRTPKSAQERSESAPRELGSTPRAPKSILRTQKTRKNTQKNTKNVKKHIKSKEKRPKANASSHNACRFGYPFFLSPSDDDAMLEIPNPTPSVHQTPGSYWFFGFVRTKKKHDSAKFPSKIKTQRQVKSQHCTVSPKSPKFQEYQNNYPK